VDFIEDDRRLTPAQAGEYLGISTDAVYELCKTVEVIDGVSVEVEPEIAHYRIGKKRQRIAIPMSSLKDYDQRTFVPARSTVTSLDAHRLKPRVAA
jgi:hypothetical protein